MSQSTVLIGALLAAFIVYLAMNNRLVTYWQLLTGGGTTTTTSATTPNATAGGILSGTLKGLH